MDVNDIFWTEGSLFTVTKLLKSASAKAQRGNQYTGILRYFKPKLFFDRNALARNPINNKKRVDVTRFNPLIVCCVWHVNVFLEFGLGVVWTLVLLEKIIAYRRFENQIKFSGATVNKGEVTVLSTTNQIFSYRPLYFNAFKIAKSICCYKSVETSLSAMKNTLIGGHRSLIRRCTSQRNSEIIAKSPAILKKILRF